MQKMSKVVKTMIINITVNIFWALTVLGAMLNVLCVTSINPHNDPMKKMRHREITYVR